MLTEEVIELKLAGEETVAEEAVPAGRRNRARGFSVSASPNQLREVAPQG